MQENKKSESTGVLVAVGKSSRLDAIRKKVEQQLVATSTLKKPKKQVFLVGTSFEVQESLEQALLIIDEHIGGLLNSYPVGKQKSFFKLKHSVDVAKLKAMTVKDIFKILALDIKLIKQFRLIETLYLDGTSSDA